MEQSTQPMQRKRKTAPGKTILIKSDKKYTEDAFTGIKTVTVSKNGSQFVVFDTVENAEAAMGDLLAEKVYSKYLQYHLFFKLINRNENSTYDEIKQNMIEKINQFDPDSKILYYKLKRRDNQLTGCGDFVVDSIETQNKLLAAKQLDLGEGVEAIFSPFIKVRSNYRYHNIQRNNSPPQNNTQVVAQVVAQN